MSELANLNVDNYDDLARAMGMATEKKAPKKTSTLNRLRIWHSPIMGKVEVNGKPTNVEVIEGGAYRLEVVSEDSSFYIFSKNITIRPFMQRFMLKRYVANQGAKGGEKKGSFHRTIMADSLNIDLKDNTGRFNCGKPSGYVEDFQALPKSTQDLIRQIKRVRVLFGTVSMEDPVDEKGVPVENFSDSPFIWEVDNKDAFKTFGDLFSELSEKSRLPIQHAMHLNGTHANQLPNGSSFYTPIVEVDYTESFEINDEDKKLFGEFSMFIKGFNDWVCKEWDTNVQKRQGDVSEAEQEVIEDFIDIDTEEVQ